MNEPICPSDPSLEASTSHLAAERHLGVSPRGVEAALVCRDSIRRRLVVVRSRIDEAIHSCVRRESRENQVETVAPWPFVPRHLTEIDSLRWLRHHLDRLTARLRPIVSPVGPPGSPDPLQEIDLALAACAEAMANRFEGPDICYDLQAEIESDLRRFEQLLDERALVDPESGFQPPRDRPAVGRAGLTSESMDARPGSGGCPDCVETLREYRDVLRRVDGHIAGAEADPPLRAFWCGVRQGYREEIERTYLPAERREEGALSMTVG